MRRNLLLARSIVATYPEATLLLLTEAREAGAFALPRNTDSLSLPAICKDAQGNSAPRRLVLSLPELIRLRSRVLESALSQFAPDALIVDHLPRGALGEIAASLEVLRARGGTRFILGMRDVLDTPEIIRAEWGRTGQIRAIEEWYDAVWIYGDPTVYNPLLEHNFPPEVADKAEFTGYLNPEDEVVQVPSEDAVLLAAELWDTKRMVLCQVGGGQDGICLAEAFIEADLPTDTTGVLVTGPFMPQDAREALVARAHARSTRLHVLGFVAEPRELLKKAERVITMGGYNSLCEVLALRKRALVVPRTYPRQEQRIRAERLASLGAIEMLHPNNLTPAALTEWMQHPISWRPIPYPAIDMGGLRRVPAYLREVLSSGWADRVHSTVIATPRRVRAIV